MYSKLGECPLCSQKYFLIFWAPTGICPFKFTCNHDNVNTYEIKFSKLYLTLAILLATFILFAGFHRTIYSLKYEDLHELSDIFVILINFIGSIKFFLYIIISCKNSIHYLKSFDILCSILQNQSKYLANFLLPVNVVKRQRKYSIGTIGCFVIIIFIYLTIHGMMIGVKNFFEFYKALINVINLYIDIGCTLNFIFYIRVFSCIYKRYFELIKDALKCNSLQEMKFYEYRADEALLKKLKKLGSLQVDLAKSYMKMAAFLSNSCFVWIILTNVAMVLDVYVILKAFMDNVKIINNFDYCAVQYQLVCVSLVIIIGIKTIDYFIHFVSKIFFFFK